ncbi:MAG: hypothetical protein H6Q07_672 [Acidobacteria bacterium]|nr:hypothetical protein [Acidobacteriota bacterium]
MDWEMRTEPRYLGLTGYRKTSVQIWNEPVSEINAMGLEIRTACSSSFRSPAGLPSNVDAEGNPAGRHQSF